MHPLVDDNAYGGLLLPISEWNSVGVLSQCLSKKCQCLSKSSFCSAHLSVSIGCHAECVWCKHRVDSCKQQKKYG